MKRRRLYDVIPFLLVICVISPMLAAERPYLRDDSSFARHLRSSSIYATAWYGTEGTIDIRMRHLPLGSDITMVEWLVINDTAQDLNAAVIAEREYECSNGEVITYRAAWTRGLDGRRADHPFPSFPWWMKRAGSNPDIITHKKSPRNQKECPRVIGVRLKGDPESFVKYLINKGDKDLHDWGEVGRVEVYQKVVRGLEIK